MIEPCAMCGGEARYSCEDDWRGTSGTLSFACPCGLRYGTALYRIPLDVQFEAASDRAADQWNRMQRLLRDGLAVEAMHKDEWDATFFQSSVVVDAGWGTKENRYEGEFTAPTLHEAVAKARGDD